MAPYITRLQYNELQFLREPDFSAEQSYHRMARYLHNSNLHTKGIASGMRVNKSADKRVFVTAGMAVDGQGRDIVLLEGEEVDLAPFNRVNTTSYLVIAFGEQDADGSIPDPNPEIRNRTEEKPAFVLRDARPSATDIEVWLAEVVFDAAGNISTVNDSTTLGEIPDSGAKIADGSVTLEKLSPELLLAFRTILRPQIAALNPVAARAGDPVTIIGQNFFAPIQVIYENQTDFSRTPDPTAAPDAANPLGQINSTVPTVPPGSYFIYVVTAFTDATGVSSDPIGFGVLP